MSRDIRTPINAVLGFTTLLSRAAENPAKVREYTGKIMSSGQYLLSLINDILDISKIESEQVVLNYETLSLYDVVSSAEVVIQPMVRNRQQVFHILCGILGVIVVDDVHQCGLVDLTKQLLCGCIGN